ncbi:15-hydroxyprostaglandin dehydrogenase [NAD(+)]-like [Belonocnema kinseyi]|uniref:15-hydroxyprostaglandin dehydrogenase [NAD(+)]-like n=1 Tax=Belonocnema kinseyi TaxID=2817044 RepID=UPI00143CE73D|nr:15-hydroxyprostaglandin dehydrogenase [NAD(+)]-like [Belonocnema kinseyi]XP_033227303.1 15-hydroxyprostaglandin dehydrogenase [NAD(+)]-like [Belonocnema kinseyi]XP_033227304.1 15-hydroxyprostaglandin dehydrogenase [NAD(+)]-like [Belonocnema kinseyi]
MKIEGKCALVTGGANGIGLNIVRNLLIRGAKCVVILDLDKEGGTEAKKNLEKEYGKNRIFFFPCDVTKLDEFEDKFKKSLEVCNKVDIFVNNSGVLNEVDWTGMIDINLRALIKGTKLALDHMGTSKPSEDKIIVNMASIGGLSKYEGSEAFAVYQASKYGVVGFSTAIKKACDDRGIKLLIICPGAVEKTNVFTNYLKAAAESKLGDFVTQTPENVGFLIVDLIERNIKETTWVIEDNKTPYAVQFPHYSTVKIASLN